MKATLVEVRFARHTADLERLVGFWRDELGLPELARFVDHAGYSGVIIGLPGTAAHLEFTTGAVHTASTPDPETLVVLYLGSWEAVRARAERLSVPPVPAANPYWDENGLTFEDPDGFRVVLAARTWT